MYSTNRLVESLPGLAGILQSSSRILKPGSPSWLKRAHELAKPNDSIATAPSNNDLTVDFTKSDLQGQSATAQEINKNATRLRRKSTVAKKKKTSPKRKPVIKRKKTTVIKKKRAPAKQNGRKRR